jgi:replicative DNA helicase
MELYSTTPSAANIVAYAEIVAKRAEAQRVQDAGRRIAACDNFADAQDLLAEARPQQAQRVKTVKDGVSGILDAMALRASGPVGLSWGISEVDRVIGKLVGSRLYGIAGRAKMGKTTASLAPQLAAVRAGKRVLNFSLEMTVAELTQRLLASVGQFDADFFERDDGVPDEAWPMIHEAAKQIIGSGLMIDDEPGLTLDKICGRATQIHMEEPLDLIVVDHMGLIHLPKRGNRNDELGEVSYTLKNLSKKLNVPILALLQLNRGLESRTDKRPTMPDIRDSGNIEQDFDCIVGVYRDEVYNPNSPDEGHAELIAIANRHRKAATAFVRAHMETMTYGPATRERRCFPGGTGSSGNGGQGGGFAGYGAKGGQSRSFSGVRGND